jgi:hypothetical protein
MEPATILKNIEVANRELTAARNALYELLRATNVSSPTETTLVTKVVEDAFERIRAAQDSLTKLEEALEPPNE